MIKQPRARILTGITTSGIPHLGNYVGAIRPAIQSGDTRRQYGRVTLFSWRICALIKCHDPEGDSCIDQGNCRDVLACGLDPERGGVLPPVGYYRNSRANLGTQL